ncbi:MAG: hypothetical protein Ct9H90mP27_1600 [Gammaproteobacteria bacterium]|nr:MAG: hypothetical protein Ct9H90mP27_1600 [Gammaproteobacteria bacterium]
MDVAVTMVHHSDTHVDATTGFRHHPGDVVFRNLATLFAVMLFGIPLACYLTFSFNYYFFRLPNAFKYSITGSIGAETQLSLYHP